MSTPLGSSQFFIDPFVEEGQSLRFEDGDSAYLSWTPASAGNRKTWTWSGWLKRGKLTPAAGGQSIFYAGNTTSSPRGGIVIGNSGDDQLTVSGMLYNSATTVLLLETAAELRDPSAWYHIVVSLDTTEATSSDRCKIYINGAEVTVFDTATYPSQNAELQYNDTVVHATRHPSGDYRYDGYLANVAFIDGQALDPTSFGEYQDTLWKPKSDTDIQALTFGTNGFYLAFEDSSAIGDDTSGNANDWTANNLVATDVVLDSPVTGGNFATLNALTYSGTNALTLSQGNLKARDATGSATWKSRWSTFAAPTTGKWYAEFYLTYTGATSFTNQAFVGLHDGLAATTYIGQSSGSYGYIASGGTYNNATHTTSYGASYNAGDIIGVAWDADNGNLTFYKNGVSQGVAYSSVSAENKFFGVSAFWVSPDGQTYWHCNFGQDSSFAGNETPQGNTDDNGVGDFYYAPPSGFLALKTSNLPAATITAPDEYFNTVLYTGSGADHSIGGVGFQPDFVWIKNRTFGAANNSYSHALFDSVRGVGRDLNSNETSAESAFSASFSLTSFDNNGFSISDGGTLTNASGSTYASWNWLADGTSVLNQQGTIDSQVSANTDAGFSIVSFTSPATSSTAFTIGHGLSSAPEMIITKERDGTLGWLVYHDELPSPKDNYLLLNSTAANSGTVTDCWGTSAPTSSVFGMKTSVSINPSKSTIAYCFHSVEGYSKIGSYTGSASLPFVHCGFRPAWILIKRTDTTSAESWTIKDTTRSPHNESTEEIYANLSNAEFDDVYGNADFLSNGFKLRSNNVHTNTTGATYIFMAFAEAPFKLANAR
jgi:hypothetical protein